MEESLKDKQAVVIGGTSGIGACIAKKLLAETAEVTVQGRRKTKQFVDFCKNPHAKGILCELNTPHIPAELHAVIESADILCIAYGPFLQKPLHTVTAQEWQETVYANLTLPGMLVSAVLPQMQRKKWGRILLFGGTETQCLRGFSTNAVYGAAKTGIMSLVRSISMSYAADNITANAICPGFTDTELLTPEQRAAWTDKNPLKRLISPETIANAALFLLKDSAYNGVLMPVDQGWSSFGVVGR